MKKQKFDFAYLIAVIIMLLIFCFVGFFLSSQSVSENELNKLMQQRTFELQKYHKNI